jgi:hypothetical protein
LAAIVLLCGGAGLAKAGPIYNTVPASDNDGPVSASVQFNAVNGGIEVIVTNTLPSTTTLAKGQAVSDFKFTVVGLSNPTGFTELKGNMVNSANFTPGSAFPGSAPVTPFDDFGTGLIDHWSFGAGGSPTVNVLATAGGSATGNPTFMILPSSGITGPGSSLADGHFDPYILGSGEFFITVPGVTASTNLTSANFTNVTVSFGTGPDSTQFGPDVPTVPNVGTVPEPSSMALLGIGAAGFAAYGWRRRRSAA